jgi:phosphoribosyl-AMP cyclohydrolase
MDLEALKWDANGLIAAIFQDAASGEVLTLAYMDREALRKTLDTGLAHVFRRSHGKVVMKGEVSGRRQVVKEICTDCDQDALVIKIEQVGGAACHTGRRTCFYQRLEGGEWQDICGPLFDPKEVYGK